MAHPTADLVRASSLGSLAWVDSSGRPHATSVFAQALGGVPVVALTFARDRLAAALAGHGDDGRAGPVSLALTEPRGTGPGFRPCLISAVPRLEVDTSGDRYLTELREDELRRYPPARLLADSMILCREHWWYLPRLVVTLPAPDVSVLAPESHGPLLVTVDGDTPRVTVVRAPDESATGRMRLMPAAGTPPIEGHAVLFEQDASFPDLERWSRWSWRGRVTTADGEILLEVEEPPPSVGLPPPRRLLDRWRRQRRLEQACRDGLARWEQ